MQYENNILVNFNEHLEFFGLNSVFWILYHG